MTLAEDDEDQEKSFLTVGVGLFVEFDLREDLSESSNHVIVVWGNIDMFQLGFPDINDGQ